MINQVRLHIVFTQRRSKKRRGPFETSSSSIICRFLLHINFKILIKTWHCFNKNLNESNVLILSLLVTSDVLTLRITNHKLEVLVHIEENTNCCTCKTLIL